MGNTFGNQKNMKELIREQKRFVDRSIRQLDREKMNLERDEKKLTMEIKTSAKKNQMKAVRIQAKDLVRIRKNQEKFVNLVAQLRAISLQMTSIQSTHAMTTSMKQITSSMMKLNKQMNLPQLTKIMQEFAKQTEQMDMKQEMIGDAIDDTMDTTEDEEETDQIVNQVLDELGVQLDDNLVNAPTSKKATQQQHATAEKQEVTEADADLQARLNNLGGGK
jgi:charged multivesicular body protein 2A